MAHLRQHRDDLAAVCADRGEAGGTWLQRLRAPAEARPSMRLRHPVHLPRLRDSAQVRVGVIVEGDNATERIGDTRNIAAPVVSDAYEVAIPIFYHGRAPAVGGVRVTHLRAVGRAQKESPARDKLQV